MVLFARCQFVHRLIEVLWNIYWFNSGRINELIYCKLLSTIEPFAALSRQCFCVVVHE